MTFLHSLWIWIVWATIEYGPYASVFLPPVLIIVAALGMRALYMERKDQLWPKRKK